jgi:hypothetical protein
MRKVGSGSKFSSGFGKRVIFAEGDGDFSAIELEGWLDQV